MEKDGNRMCNTEFQQDRRFPFTKQGMIHLRSSYEYKAETWGSNKRSRDNQILI